MQSSTWMEKIFVIDQFWFKLPRHHVKVVVVEEVDMAVAIVMVVVGAAITIQVDDLHMVVVVVDLTVVVTVVAVTVVVTVAVTVAAAGHMEEGIVIKAILP